jgi:hypothetical protein
MCKSFSNRIFLLTLSLFAWLAASPCAADVQAKVVEFYNVPLDAYFITARVDEQSALDGVADFRRTGMSFTAAPAFQPAPPDYVSVCRFFISSDNPFVRSHFYGRGDTDCADLLSRSVFPVGFTYEGEDFKTPMPISGACAAPATPIYRSFRAAANGKTSNHRYSASSADHAAAQRVGYVDEGIAFCVTGASAVAVAQSRDWVKRAEAIYAVSRIFAEPGPATDSAFLYPHGNYSADVYSATTKVDGVMLRFGWDALEPAAGAYAFRQIVFETKRAAQAGKKIQLLVIAGTHTPASICPRPANPALACAPGAPDVTRPYCFQSYDSSRDGSSAGGCKCRVVPVPWAAEVQAPFRAMLSALKNALLDTALGGLSASEFDMIRIVRANGINYQTEELKMPTGATNPAPGSNCNDDTVVAAAWRGIAAPYSAAKVLQTWESNVKFVQGLFPDTATSVALTSDSFPADPMVSTGAQAQQVTNKFIVTEIRKALLDPARFGGRHFMQVNALSPTFAPSELLAARDAGVPIAFQTNLWLGTPDRGATCGKSVNDAVLCTDDQAATSFRALLERGLCSGAHYLEIFAPDVARYPNSIAVVRAQPFGALPTCS